jgi:cytoskeletal protein CcmA (bactofilin family)
MISDLSSAAHAGDLLSHGDDGVTTIRWLTTAIALALAALLVPATALAADFRPDDTVVVGSNETIDDDLYAVGQSITIQGTVNGSVFAAGNTVTVTGVVNGDLFAAGATVVVPGQVRGSVRAAASTVSLAGPVGRDLIAAGGAVDIAPGGGVGHDALVAAGRASLAGPIGRNLWAGVGDLAISAPIGGSVEADVDSLRLAEGARVGGDLSYRSRQEAAVAPGATVAGTLARGEPAAWREPPSAAAQAERAVAGWLRSLVGLAALGVGLALLFPRFLGRAADAATGSPWASLGLGLGDLIGGPILALVVIVVGALVGGWWLGLAGLGLYALALVIGYVLAAFALGRWLLVRVGQPGRHPAWAALLGLVVLGLLAALPYVGGLVAFLAMLLGTGAFTLALVGGYRGSGAAALTLEPLPARPVEVLRESA